MSERFNNGYGGYTCDACRKLLWAGFNGLEVPKQRRYIYDTKQAEVVIDLVLKVAFCSNDCATEESHGQ